MKTLSLLNALYHSQFRLWNAMENNVALTESEILQLNTIAQACSVSLQLDEQGKMEVAD